MTTEEDTKQSSEADYITGWEAVRDILGDFLVVFLGTWMMARGMLSLIATFHEMAGPPVYLLILQIATSIGIISLGVDRWRAHSKASARNLPDQPRRKRWYEDDYDEDED